MPREQYGLRSSETLPARLKNRTVAGRRQLEDRLFYWAIWHLSDSGPTVTDVVTGYCSNDSATV
jgi:hypothetical protein